jgi:hypothetical protein
MFLFSMCLSILRMGDAPAFMIKVHVHAFVMGEGMGDAPLATRVSFAFIIKDAY